MAAAVVVVTGAAVGDGVDLSDRKNDWQAVREPKTALRRIADALIEMEKDCEQRHYDNSTWSNHHFAMAVENVLTATTVAKRSGRSQHVPKRSARKAKQSDADIVF